MTGIRPFLHRLIDRKVSISPLVTFRVLFGLLMFASVVRFWTNGWIEKQYIEPSLHFKYFGFHWIPEPSTLGIYLLFILVGLSALGIALGLVYRLSTILFFLSFTYIELIDATYYLNHYYFVSLVGFLLIFMPAHRLHSLDVRFGLTKSTTKVPAGYISLIKFQLAIVYLFAGIAKLNADWLLHAMPLALWLPAQDHLPIIGPFMKLEITPYLMSWAGAIYDLTIPFLLIISRTRTLAYLMVIAFHLMTWWFFQIGMFPFIMIGATLIFFSPAFHERVQSWLLSDKSIVSAPHAHPVSIRSWALFPAACFILFQVAFPFRYLSYDGNPFWHEQGYRYGWRVMLIEKAGYAQFKVVNGRGQKIEVDNKDFLTPVQEKMMSTQPDFMIQYAKILKNHYKSIGVDVAGVNADVHVTLNGRSSKPYIKPEVDLAAQVDSWQPKTWILPFES